MKLSAYGMFLMVLAGILLNILLGISQHLVQLGWPNLLLMAVAEGLLVCCIIARLLLVKPALPTGADRKWLLAAGACAALSISSTMLAVGSGISLGDLASLNSTNVVFAALLGRLFLAEPLRAPHAAAVLGSISGGLLITKPQMLFGHGATEQTAGNEAYVFALLNGLFAAGIFLCSRRISNVHPAYLALSFEAQGGLALFVFAASKANGLQLEPLLRSPFVAAGWLAGLFVTTLACSICFSTASQWCPAAASATTDTATRMLVGYAAQVVLAGEELDALTIGGAALMLGGVAAMAFVSSVALTHWPLA